MGKIERCSVVECPITNHVNGAPLCERKPSPECADLLSQLNETGSGPTESPESRSARIAAARLALQQQQPDGPFVGLNDDRLTGAIGEHYADEDPDGVQLGGEIIKIAPDRGNLFTGHSGVHGGRRNGAS